MKPLDKLRTILPHWIEHTAGHGSEFSTWAQTLQEEQPEIARLLEQARISLNQAGARLEEALKAAGGPLEGKHPHQHHGHHHHH